MGEKKRWYFVPMAGEAADDSTVTSFVPLTQPTSRSQSNSYPFNYPPSVVIEAEN